MVAALSETYITKTAIGNIDEDVHDDHDPRLCIKQCFSKLLPLPDFVLYADLINP